MMRVRAILLAAVLAVFAEPPAQLAAEICGNLDDDDSDGYADEGCNPAAVPAVGIHESPLPSSVTGVVAPGSGQLIWTEPPDLSPNVPYGPPLVFQRTYMSQRDTGGWESVGGLVQPLGNNWTHSFMGYLMTNANSFPTEIVIHLPTGQEFLMTKSGGTWSAQPGYQVKSLFQNGMGNWMLTTLDGWIYEFDDVDWWNHIQASFSTSRTHRTTN